MIYDGIHMLAQSAVVGGFWPWREAIDKVEALEPATSSPVTRTRSSTTTPTVRSRSRGSTSTTPTNSANREPRWTSSTPSSSAPNPRAESVGGVSAIYGAREHPAEDARKYALAGWL